MPMLAPEGGDHLDSVDDLKRVVRKDEEPDFYQHLEEAVFEDHNTLEIKGVTWVIESYDSEPDAKIVLIRQGSR